MFAVETDVYGVWALSEESAEFLALAAWARARGLPVRRLASDADVEHSTHERASFVMLDAASDPLGAVAQCACIRARWPESPMLVLGPGRGEQERFREAAMRFGATVLLERPVAEALLLAAFETCVRAQHQRGATPRFVSLGGAYTLDLEGRCLRVGDVEQALTKGKFDLLAYLIGHPGQAVAADDLVRAGVLARSQISRYRAIVQELRSKLGAAGASIRTVPGYGYRFDPPNAACVVPMKREAASGP
jgi:DNA-binding response OmpR family regulator